MNFIATLLTFITAIQNAATQIPSVVDLVRQVINAAEEAGKSLFGSDPVASTAAIIAAVGKAAGNTKLDPHAVAAVAANVVAANAKATVESVQSAANPASKFFGL